MDGAAAASKNAVERMIDVMREVGSIGKDRKSPTLQYAFRGIDDITPVVQPLFVKHGLILTMRILRTEREVVQTSKGTSMFSVRLEVEHTFRSPDGSTVVASAWGEAMDQMDKASNKAMTAALKATLTTSFTIPVNDPEADTEASPQAEIATPGKSAKAATAKAAPAASRSAGTPRAAPRASQGASGAVFPPYGNAKGQPVEGAARKDLEFYRGGCLRSLADPAKERFHGKEQALLAAIDDELSRLDMNQAGNGASGGIGPDDPDGPPPLGDEDAPF